MTEPHIPLEYNQTAPAQPDKADDLVERLREESLQLARRSFDSADAGISANLCDAAIDEIDRLRAQLAAAEARIAQVEGLHSTAEDDLHKTESQLAIARKALYEIANYYTLDSSVQPVLIAREALRSLNPDGDGK